jgi:hypothetical protein
MPRSLDDIAPQLDFLWPGQALGYQASTSENVSELLRPLYVRTTKGELGLPPISRHFEQVRMSQGQLALYSLIRQQALSNLAGIRSDPNVDLSLARRSVMRLLQVSSNPILMVRRVTMDPPDAFQHNDAILESIFNSIVVENDSPKLQRACSLAREVLQGDRESRVVIWSTFTENIERIAELLSDEGALFIHGQVPVGSESDMGTREGRIRAFHDPSDRWRVLVANPAACGEGISLHKVCHNAIYLDRSYNAAHYLQSVDRIHRLGLPENTVTNVYVLESVSPGIVGSVDYSVRRRLINKLRTMASALEDADLTQMALDEEEGEQPLDFDITIEDVADLIDELSGSAAEPGDENWL